MSIQEMILELEQMNTKMAYVKGNEAIELATALIELQKSLIHALLAQRMVLMVDNSRKVA
jgi:hypothetical protein